MILDPEMTITEILGELDRREAAREGLLRRCDVNRPLVVTGDTDFLRANEQRAQAYLDARRPDRVERRRKVY